MCSVPLNCLLIEQKRVGLTVSILARLLGLDYGGKKKQLNVSDQHVLSS